MCAPVTKVERCGRMYSGFLTRGTFVAMFLIRDKSRKGLFSRQRRRVECAKNGLPVTKVQTAGCELGLTRNAEGNCARRYSGDFCHTLPRLDADPSDAVPLGKGPTLTHRKFFRHDARAQEPTKTPRDIAVFQKQFQTTRVTRVKVEQAMVQPQDRGDGEEAATKRKIQPIKWAAQDSNNNRNSLQKPQFEGERGQKSATAAAVVEKRTSQLAIGQNLDALREAIAQGKIPLDQVLRTLLPKQKSDQPGG